MNVFILQSWMGLGLLCLMMLPLVPQRLTTYCKMEFVFSATVAMLMLGDEYHHVEPLSLQGCK